MKNLIPDGLTNLSRGSLTLLRTLYGKIAGIIGYPALIFCIDEAMVSYSGRINHTTKMKNKPIAEGFKIWVLWAIMVMSAISYGIANVMDQRVFPKGSSLINYS
jgi:hypothetical protein